MAKLRGPDFITLQVRDLAISRRFYVETLRFTVDPRFDTLDFVLFDTNSIPFGLGAAKVNLDDAPQPGWGVALWIDCGASASPIPMDTASRSTRIPGTGSSWVASAMRRSGDDRRWGAR